jgi:hypothetical protein
LLRRRLAWKQERMHHSDEDLRIWLSSWDANRTSQRAFNKTYETEKNETKNKLFTLRKYGRQ